jgi:3-deoxy-manno-octulosonate cytidylyltransferase (CMP-KDO synthetase)
VAEVAAVMPWIDIFVNLQGDEPELPSSALDLVIELLESNPRAAMATVAAPIRQLQQLRDPACVKVVLDRHARALYFSRSPIPHVRDWRDDLLAEDPPHFFQHLGLYAYRRPFLLALAGMPPSDLEKLEKLEQLRVLDAGHTILVGVIAEASRGIDTLDDYRAFVSRSRRQ